MTNPATRRAFLKTTGMGMAAMGFSGASAFAQSSSDQTSWTGTQTVAELRARRITSEALVKAALSRAERLRHMNLFTALDPDKALAAARDIDRRRAAGEDVGPLAGMPLIIKDNIDSAALPTTAGSTAFAGWQPKKDAPVLAALLKAGGVMLGKANMHEMAFGATSNNPVYGPVRNPYNTSMIPGGSSGGTAAAIGARVVTGGLGSDTGGSCRVPAALCGCVGFRPTMGRYSTAGVIPLTWTLDTPGPLARTVDDVMLLDAACAKRPANVPALTLSGTRLAIPTILYQDLDSQLAQVVTNTLGRLRKAGAVFVDVDIAPLRQGGSSGVPEGPRAVATYLVEHGSRMSVFEVFDKVKGPVERQRLLTQLQGGPTDASAFVEALVVRRAAHLARVAAFFKDNNITAVLLPTTPLPARPIGQDDTVELNGKQVQTFTTFIRHSGFGSQGGLPCLSVPVGLTAAGLPVGMELVGPSEGDGTVFALGKALESLVGFLPAPSL